VRIVFVNGRYVPEDEARISIFDRSVLFADSIYEVWAVLDGKPLDVPSHLARMRRSVRELHFGFPQTDDGILEVVRQLVSRNRMTEGLVYMQVTRGCADRDFLPPEVPAPGWFAFTQAKAVAQNETVRRGLRIVTLPDVRWLRRDIKTTQLLASALAKREAVSRGADDAWMVEDGLITEGTSSNAYIVTDDGRIVTRHLSNAILAGCTRAAVLQLAAEAGLKVDERAFSPAEAHRAREAFVTAASALVTGVVEIDGRRISDGRPGPLTCRLREIYLDAARRFPD